jgi:hypothetical protein
LITANCFSVFSQRTDHVRTAMPMSSIPKTTTTRYVRTFFEIFLCDLIFWGFEKFLFFFVYPTVRRF